MQILKALASLPPSGQDSRPGLSYSRNHRHHCHRAAVHRLGGFRSQHAPVDGAGNRH